MFSFIPAPPSSSSGRQLRGSASSRRTCGEGTTEAHSISRQHLAPDREEQDEPLQHPHQAGGEVRTLQAVAGVGESAEEDRDDHRSQRVGAGQCGDHDAHVAEPALLQATWIQRVGEVPDLACSTDAGDAARQHHHGDDLAPSAHPRVACRGRRVPDGEDLEAEPRAGVDELEDDGEPHAQDEAQRDDDGQTRSAERPDEEHHRRHRQEDEGLEPTLRQVFT